MMITLAGGKQVEDYDNRHCRICGKELHEEVVCRKYQGNICQKHCDDCGSGHACEWYIPYLQRCRYGGGSGERGIKEVKLAYHRLYGDKQYTYIVRGVQDGKKWGIMRKRKMVYGRKGRRDWKEVQGLEWKDSLEEAEKILESYAREKGLSRIL